MHWWSCWNFDGDFGCQLIELFFFFIIYIKTSPIPLYNLLILPVPVPRYAWKYRVSGNPAFRGFKRMFIKVNLTLRQVNMDVKV